ncbi:MAG TPA: aldo/keto reductase [Bryobacterales bacterium]|nr:aldo/keto reductase [Bryobacterales bacterium]
MRKTARLKAGLPAVCRLGLATRGNTHLRPEDVEHAIDRGINYLNWCGKPDGLSETIAALGPQRKGVAVAVQFKASGADEAAKEFDSILRRLKTDYLDIATLYYVESEAEWQALIAPQGAWRTLARLSEQGALRMIGLTSHQRKLAAGWAQQVDADTGRRRLDMLMLRYNAAHRGVEQDVFPVTDALGTPVVTFTGLRWKDLLARTADDPADFAPPTAPDCYRFCLTNKSVAVALMAPGNRAELEQDLALLDDWTPLKRGEMQSIQAHGDRVRKNAREFW